MESVLIIAILVQSVAIVLVYDGAFSHHQAVSSAGSLGLGSVGDNTTLASLNDSANDREGAPSADDTTNIDDLGVVRHTTPNPGGLILAASFSYLQVSKHLL